MHLIRRLAIVAVSLGLASISCAQMFGPNAARNVVLGGAIGAVIGNSQHHRGAEGAVLGATAGLLWGSLGHTPQRSTAYVQYGEHHRPFVYPPRSPHAVYVQAPPARIGYPMMPEPAYCYQAPPPVVYARPTPTYAYPGPMVIYPHQPIIRLVPSPEYHHSHYRQSLAPRPRASYETRGRYPGR